MALDLYDEIVSQHIAFMLLWKVLSYPYRVEYAADN